MPEAPREILPDRSEAVEVRPLIPTPERLSQLLEMDIEDVRRMYVSVGERGRLVDEIMAQRDTLQEYHSNIYREELEELVRVGGEHLSTNPEASLPELERTLSEVQQMLAAKRDFMTETSPGRVPDDGKEAVLQKVEESKAEAKTEKERGFWGKVWDTVTWLPRKHPVVTALLLMAGTAWGLYALWSYLGDIIIVPNPMEGAGEVADTVIQPTGGNFKAIPEGGIDPPTLNRPSTGPGGFFRNGPR